MQPIGKKNWVIRNDKICVKLMRFHGAITWKYIFWSAVT